MEAAAEFSGEVCFGAPKAGCCLLV